MTPRAIALHMLMQVAQHASYPDGLLDVYFKDHPQLDGRDRALITELVYGVLRWQARLDWIIDQHIRIKPGKVALPVRLILRLSTYQLVFLDRIPASAAVNEAVKLAKASQPQHVVGFVNGVLRNISRQADKFRKGCPQVDPVEHLAVNDSFPAWLIERWFAQIGYEETAALCRASNQVAPTTIRVNTLRTLPEVIAAELRDLGVTVESGIMVPEALQLKRIRTDLSALSPYRRGEFQVQDEASQLIAHLTCPKPGERVLDGCAGLGAKSTHLAQLMENQGEIVSVDKHGWKLARLMESAQRQQISCIETLEADVLDLKAADDQERFDKILLDAPCTGLGVLRRNPDIKWRVKPKDFYRLHRFQQDMLRRMADMLRPGGVLVYATCTLSSEENESTVQAFLNEHPRFFLESPLPYLPPGCESVVDPSGALQTWPHRHGVDGFYGVRLRCQ